MHFRRCLISKLPPLSWKKKQKTSKSSGKPCTGVHWPMAAAVLLWPLFPALIPLSGIFWEKPPTCLSVISWDWLFKRFPPMPVVAFMLLAKDLMLFGKNCLPTVKKATKMPKSKLAVPHPILFWIIWIIKMTKSVKKRTGSAFRQLMKSWKMAC